MKCHAVCYLGEDYPSNLCSCAAEFQTVGWRLHIMSDIEKETLQTCSRKNLFEKNAIKEINFFALEPYSFNA